MGIMETMKQFCVKRVGVPSDMHYVKVFATY